MTPATLCFFLSDMGWVEKASHPVTPRHDEQDVEMLLTYL